MTMHFGETIGRMLSQMTDGQEKDMLKLEMQRMILSVKYAESTPPLQSANRFSNS